ncbi:hypothetical protein CC2G_005086 [Coprinopsis cinerea AmutBmut pab1-1]|nr:hypothetical protein CC2G_005086 [Coprinopsis cinerea AmutBmut pab1-1]
MRSIRALGLNPVASAQALTLALFRHLEDGPIQQSSQSLPEPTSTDDPTRPLPSVSNEPSNTPSPSASTPSASTPSESSPTSTPSPPTPTHSLSTSTNGQTDGPALPGPSAESNVSSDSASRSTPVGAIVGGAVGGAAALALFACLALCFCLRQRQRQKREETIAVTLVPEPATFIFPSSPGGPSSQKGLKGSIFPAGSSSPQQETTRRERQQELQQQLRAVEQDMTQLGQDLKRGTSLRVGESTSTAQEGEAALEEMRRQMDLMQQEINFLRRNRVEELTDDPPPGYSPR